MRRGKFHIQFIYGIFSMIIIRNEWENACLQKKIGRKTLANASVREIKVQFTPNRADKTWILMRSNH